MADNFDIVALIRAVAIGLGVSLAGGAINRHKKPFLVASFCIGALIAIALFISWPSLITVPSLDQLSKAEAEELLRNKKLVSQFTEAYTPVVKAGRVIPGSQQPSPGLKIRSRETVTFTVAAEPTISLSEPRTGERVVCSQNADNIYRFTVRGTSIYAPEYFKVLLWVQPVNHGWYLQRLPVNIDSQGFFSGTVQIGNRQWPPNEGDQLNLAITLTENQTASHLMSQTGEVVVEQPIGLKRDMASGVIVTLKERR